MELKPKLRRFLSDFLDESKLSLLERCLTLEPRVCVRTNTLKISSKRLVLLLTERGWQLTRVPWFKDAFFVEGATNVGKTPEHLLGYYYTQDGSSLVPPVVLDAKPGERILDLCAAPGSKTTQIAAMMHNEGAIVANDVSSKRCKALQFNLQRCGVINAIVTMMDGRKFHELGITFDRVLVDAPCTGTGKLIGIQGKGVNRQWQFYAGIKLARLQRKLLESAVKCTKKGGVVVYSTCSLDPRENEAVITKVAEKFELELEKIDVPGLKYERGLKAFDGREFVDGIEGSIRIYPWHNQTEGFFVCRMVVKE